MKKTINDNVSRVFVESLNRRIFISFLFDFPFLNDFAAFEMMGSLFSTEEPTQTELLFQQRILEIQSDRSEERLIPPRMDYPPKKQIMFKYLYL